MVAKKATRQTGSKSRTAKKTRRKTSQARGRAAPKYPRHSVEKALRVPKAILEQNAGRSCSDREAAQFVGVGYGGDFKVEMSSGIKYGLLERPQAGKIRVTKLAKRILRPQSERDRLEGMREATLQAPDISTVYTHYRGENLPDEEFLKNALLDKFKIPEVKLSEFRRILLQTLLEAKLLEEHNGKYRVVDVSQEATYREPEERTLKKLEKTGHLAKGDSCFVMMPFADPIGGYYEAIYEPAIKNAGLVPVRADDDIFSTGKIIDQVWSGIHAARILLAELTTRNPNVYYELGLAHALGKPVVLVSRGEEDVPFDLQHIRVIYYDVNDPFWGDKLMAKVSENLLSAIGNPEEATFDGGAS